MREALSKCIPFKDTLVHQAGEHATAQTAETQPFKKKNIKYINSPPSSSLHPEKFLVTTLIVIFIM